MRQEIQRPREGLAATQGQLAATQATVRRQQILIQQIYEPTYRPKIHSESVIKVKSLFNTLLGEEIA